MSRTAEYMRSWSRRNADKVREYRRARYLRRRNLIDTLKAAPCADCGIQYPSWVMQFDHVRGDKLFDIGAIHHGKNEMLISAEAEKCEVVCANCHADRTYRRRLGD